ncbi:MAG: lamin tail domain-containing protein [Minisyncoccia bacterium]
MRILAIVLILFFARTASAQVFISEIKYTGNEWIEVSNSGESADLSLWKFYEGGTNHKLKSVQGGSSLSSGSYAIIANDATAFLNEYGGFSGILFDSSFSLLDVGETISIKSSDTNIVDTVSYTGIKGSKNSTQKIGGVWSEAIPTPGAINSVSQNVDTATTQTSNTEVVPTTATSQVTAQAGPQTRVVLAGAPIIFEGKIAGLENNNVVTHTTWSFGDGASAEGESVTHTYYYPGEYTAVLDVVSGSLKATDKMLVRVVLPNLSLRTGGDVLRSFISIQNQGGDEMDISGWQVVAGEKTFTFPKNTILGARRSATFASEVTGLATPSGSTAELLFPNGSRVDTKVETVANQPILPKTVEKPKVVASTEARTVSQSPQTPQNQEASVLNAVADAPTSPTQKEEGSLWPWYIGSAFLGALALLGLRLTREKNTETPEGPTADDYEIIEDVDGEEPH